MRVLLVSNSTERCGVANFGRLHYDALGAAGADVTWWSADYPRYLPDNAAEYDIVHFNSHPATIHHIQPQHFPQGPLISTLFHEVPNQWWEENAFPDTWHASDLRLTEEPIPGWGGDGKTIYWQMPVPDYVPISKPFPLCEGYWYGPDKFLDRPYYCCCAACGAPCKIGRTGILPDGIDWLESVAQRHGWRVSKSGENGWLPIEAEIERLAACHLVDCSRHSSYSGQASSVLTAIASRRPVLVNSARILNQIRTCDAALANELYFNDSVEDGVLNILDDIRAGKEKRPIQLANRYSWRSQTEVLLGIWQKSLGS